jgi:threonine dehydrogenase-like Zn-dependent dehydrogenase
MKKDMMRAAILTAPRKFTIAQLVRPEPGPKQVCVRLEGCGVCASNLASWEGAPWFSYPMEAGTPGHEGWGRVYGSGGAVTRFRPGSRVGLLSQHAFAEYDVVDEELVVGLPESLNKMPFPAEPLGCAVNVFRRANISEGQTIAIVGIGFLGAVVLRLAALAGARVIAITRKPESLDLARRYGAHECIPMNDHWQIIERVKQLTSGRFCDVVVEATGQQWPLDLSAEITADRSRMVVAGYHQGGPRQVNMQLWNWRGLEVVSAHERDPAVYLLGMQAAVDLIARGELDPAPLYTHYYPLERIGDAFETAASRPGGFMKALITFRS